VTVKPPSPPFIAAKHHGGAQTPRLIVLHSTVGPTKTGSAKGVAEFFAREDDQPTSAHYVVDETTRYQCVGTTRSPTTAGTTRTPSASRCATTRRTPPRLGGRPGSTSAC
jgi:N-acetylmuramoyl-L-alanine amidase CwlA